MEKKFTVNVNENLNFELSNLQVKDLDLAKLTSKKYHALVNNQSYHIQVIEQNYFTKNYTVEVNSNTYNVKISSELDKLIKQMGFTIGSSIAETTIKAPMPGLILDLPVKEGQTVKEGETLLILEAMKMENAITAQKDSIIGAIHVKSGQSVDKGQLLIELQ
jgi:biotin carboxyl carrier protein